MRIYFDNAATSPLEPMVLEEMLPFFKEDFGNPSSVHALGRKAKATVETARKDIAKVLGCLSAELFFTSGGTEADNIAIIQTVISNNIKFVISSPIEHHAVLHSVQFLERTKLCQVFWVKHDEKGQIDLVHFQKLLQNCPRALVSIMHANNEIGNLNPIEEMAKMVKEVDGFFHSDCVQTVGHYPFNLKNSSIDLISASAHKFNGPKGIGFLYKKPHVKLETFMFGGNQEKGLRSGTENVAFSVGMAKALSLSSENMDRDMSYVSDLKKYFVSLVRLHFPEWTFNGLSGDELNTNYSIVSLQIPAHEDNQMLLFNLDLVGVCVSGGSACASGSLKGSHVLQAIQPNSLGASLRFSFSRFNTKDEIDFAIAEMIRMFH